MLHFVSAFCLTLSDPQTLSTPLYIRLSRLSGFILSLLHFVLPPLPHEVDRGQEFTLRWSGGAGSVNVYQKEGDKFKLIPPNKRNDIYAQTINGTAAKLTFSKSADYKIEVRGTNGGSDSLFLSVSNPFPIIELLLIIGFIVAGVFAFNKFFRPGPKHNSGDDNGWEGNNRSRQTDSHASSGNDDW